MSTGTEPKLIVLTSEPPKRRGRPRATEPKTALTAWVPTSYHDRLSRLALKHDVSVSSLVCRVLREALSRRP